VNRDDTSESRWIHLKVGIQFVLFLVGMVKVKVSIPILNAKLIFYFVFSPKNPQQRSFLSAKKSFEQRKHKVFKNLSKIITSLNQK